MGRYLRELLVQPPVQNRVNYEVGPGCSGLFLVESWKPPRMETTQPLWGICSNSWLSSCWIFFLLVPSVKQFLYFSLCPLSFVLMLCTTMKSLSLCTWQSPHRHWKTSTSPAKSHLISRLSKPSSLSLFSYGECASAWPSLGSSVEFTTVNWCISCTGGPNLAVILYVV